MLLTSAGIKNESIRARLVELLGKSITESTALCIPTAVYPMAQGAEMAWKFVTGNEPRTPMCELGWKSLAVLELTALPTVERSVWEESVRAADALLVNGGDALYLNYWLHESGLAALLPSLDIVYVGLSAGSIVMSPTVAEEFAHWVPPDGSRETLGFVDFAIFPHLNHESLPMNSMTHAERWASKIAELGYAIDDETAISVSNGKVDLVSEGEWRLFSKAE